MPKLLDWCHKIWRKGGTRAMEETITGSRYG